MKESGKKMIDIDFLRLSSEEEKDKNDRIETFNGDLKYLENTLKDKYGTIPDDENIGYISFDKKLETYYMREGIVNRIDCLEMCCSGDDRRIKESIDEAHNFLQYLYIQGEITFSKKQDLDNYLETKKRDLTHFC